MKLYRSYIYNRRNEAVFGKTFLLQRVLSLRDLRQCGKVIPHCLFVWSYNNESIYFKHLHSHGLLYICLIVYTMYYSTVIQLNNYVCISKTNFCIHKKYACVYTISKNTCVTLSKRCMYEN